LYAVPGTSVNPARLCSKTTCDSEGVGDAAATPGPTARHALTKKAKPTVAAPRRACESQFTGEA